MYRHGPYTSIGSIKINQVSSGASINYGPTIHKGHQANIKFQAGEYIIGDEFVFNFCNNEETANENNDNNEEDEDNNTNINIVYDKNLYEWITANKGKRFSPSLKAKIKRKEDNSEE
ncbi:hypothetical protein [Bacillus alkalicellulosilyticus]|uniref:hypothetical protein n=1 Tax=Alkalihalobacterium alkalicellulosilyticum TaxID=1912214 RepID=UPI0009961578|nr:hypothetical protein [Bacillus alkalicellulosilyticus]